MKSGIWKRFYSTLKLKPRLNLKQLLEDPQKLKRNAEERRCAANLNVDLISELNAKRISLTQRLNDLNALRKSEKSNISTGSFDKDSRKQLMKELSDVEDGLLMESSKLPNFSSAESPIEENKILRESPIPEGSETRADHVDICKQFGLVDFEGPARTSGAHFIAFKGIAALLEMALTSWAVNRAIQRGFQPVLVPDCVRERFLVGCGFAPRRESKPSNSKLPVFSVNDPENQDDPLILAGTSEIYLAAQHSGKILTANQIPAKYVGVSHCFRSEVGHHTAASRGLYRVHQFTKVELFAFCEPGDSSHLFSEISGLQASLLEELNLPFRVLEMARWELGASAARKWDHEVWMPGRRIWGEVMSASDCTDFQSRRLDIRYRPSGPDQELEFPHTLNGTACAVPRIVMALLEYGWDPVDPDWLNIPATLRPFMLTFNDSSLKIRFK